MMYFLIVLDVEGLHLHGENISQNLILLREELKILCLNCNEIRQPASKPKEDTILKSKPKKESIFS